MHVHCTMYLLLNCIGQLKGTVRRKLGRVKGVPIDISRLGLLSPGLKKDFHPKTVDKSS